MLHTLPAAVPFLTRLYQGDRPEVPYRTRCEQRLIRTYLPATGQGRTLSLAGDADSCARFTTDHHRLRPADFPRTPFPQRSFAGIACFRLAAQLDAPGLDDLLWEASRLCTPGGRLLLAVPARATAGHIAHTPAAVEELLGTRWRQVTVVGIDLLPVDRLPQWLRGAAGQLNDRLCRTPLRRFARSRAYVLELR